MADRRRANFIVRTRRWTFAAGWSAWRTDSMWTRERDAWAEAERLRAAVERKAPVGQRAREREHHEAGVWFCGKRLKPAAPQDKRWTARRAPISGCERRPEKGADNP